MKRFTAIFIAVLCAIVSMFSLIACEKDSTSGSNNGASDGNDQTVTVESIKLNKTTVTLNIGETETLTAAIYPDYDNIAITWSVDKPEIANVDKASGKVTAMSAGTAIVTATAGGKIATCTVTVNSNDDKPPVDDDDIPVSSVKLDKSAIMLDLGYTATLKATVLPDNATDKTVTWSVSPVGIVTVDGGIITAVSDGTATVTATAGGKSATCEVTVKLEPSEGLLYTLNEDNESYTVTKGDATDTTIVIPSEYNGLPVTTIGYEAFLECASITRVVIPDSITTIDQFAFAKCTSLADAKIPNSVTTIGNYAFAQCASLTRVVIPDSVATIGDYAFLQCSSVESVTIGSGLNSMGYAAFLSCLRLVEVYNLSTLTIEKKSTGPNYCYVANYALDVYTSLDDESKLVETDDCVFYEDGDTVYLICYTGESTDIALPEDFNSKAYSIYRYAFYKCTTVENITIPNGVTSIGTYAFQNCSSLESISIPKSVTSIGNYAFYGCTSLESITLPDSITTIGDYMFYACKSLESITLPDSLTGNIGPKSFDSCTSLQSITIPEGVTSIYDYAFNDCASLNSIILPTTLDMISVWVFSGCTALDTVYYKGTEEEWERVRIGSSASNQPLVDATRYYYSENEPMEEGAFWHYDTDGVTPVIWYTAV